MRYFKANADRIGNALDGGCEKERSRLTSGFSAQTGCCVAMTFTEMLNTEEEGSDLWCCRN